MLEPDNDKIIFHKGRCTSNCQHCVTITTQSKLDGKTAERISDTNAYINCRDNNNQQNCLFYNLPNVIVWLISPLICFAELFALQLALGILTELFALQSVILLCSRRGFSSPLSNRILKLCGALSI